MPFGEELNAGTPNRTESQKYALYGADNIRKRFTGYEKDQETGLDFAEARYYQNKHGRFTAVDPLLASGKSANPQTFNRYAYVLGNPLKFTDPTGLQAGTHLGKVFTDGKGAYYPSQTDGTHQFTGESFYLPATDGFSYMVSSGGYYSIGNTAEMAASGETNSMADSRTRESAYANSALPSSWIPILQLDPPGYAEAARTGNRYAIGAAGAERYQTDSQRAFGMAVTTFSTLGGALGGSGAAPTGFPARSDMITVTHRGSPENIAGKLEAGVLSANMPKPNNAFTRFFDHSRPAVWVSAGGTPNPFTRTFSGMLFRGRASITFEMPRSLVRSPNGFKFVFGPTQRVIEQDVIIPPDAIVKGLPK